MKLGVAWQLLRAARLLLASEEVASAPLWDAAVQDLHKFNALYAQVERKPKDLATLKKAINGTNKLLNIWVWVKKCLTKDVYEVLRSAAGAVSKMSKEKAATADELLGALRLYNAAVQEAVDSAAPETFSYQGFDVLNEEHISDELSRKALSGVDFLKALFKKRGVQHLLEAGIAKIVLVLDAEGAAAYFHSGTRELVLSVPALSKGDSGRFIDTFTGETILHEFGHYVHRNYITGEAAEAWNSPWDGISSLADPKNRYNPDPKRQEKLDPLEIVTDYGKTDKYEDFAETFMVFMAAPEKLTPTAKYRMQQALSLSGLYGKPVIQLARLLLADPSEDQLVQKVQSVLDDSLRRPKYRGHENLMTGQCYVASEALFYLLGGKAAGWTPMFISHEGEPHWFLRNADGHILDATASQFKTPVPYEKARGKGFLTLKPSKRAQEVIDRVAGLDKRAGMLTILGMNEARCTATGSLAGPFGSMAQEQASRQGIKCPECGAWVKLRKGADGLCSKSPRIPAHNDPALVKMFEERKQRGTP